MSDFTKKLDDVVRQELLLLGRDYREIVASIDETQSGAIVRLHPPHEDVEFETPPPDVADDVFSARVARRIKVALEAPERPPAPEE
ncbi:MAG: hypothetical protein ACRD2J_05585 [Thermoanaerobaculia bacterium]